MKVKKILFSITTIIVIVSALVLPAAAIVDPNSEDYKAGYQQGEADAYLEFTQGMFSNAKLSVRADFYDLSHRTVEYQENENFVAEKTIYFTENQISTIAADLQALNTKAKQVTIHFDLARPTDFTAAGINYSGTNPTIPNATIVTNKTNTFIQLEKKPDAADSPITYILPPRYFNGNYEDRLIKSITFYFDEMTIEEALTYFRITQTNDVQQAGYNKGYYEAMKNITDQIQAVKDEYEQKIDDLKYQNKQEVLLAREAGYVQGKNEGLAAASQGDFQSLFFSVIDAPINAFQSLFSFEILGLDMRVFMGSLIVLCIVIIIFKKII